MILLNEMKKICFITICCLLAIAGCKETGRLDHLDMDAPAPGQISNVKVKPLPGGAMLTYDIPQDDHLSYVLAVYEIQPGVVRQAKSSVYTDTLRLDGFGDVSSRTVQLYSVGKKREKIGTGGAAVRTTDTTRTNSFPVDGSFRKLWRTEYPLSE